jgi:hypothetical protein
MLGALAHVRALEVKEAGGERFICGNGPFSGNDYCVVRLSPLLALDLADFQILNKLYPDDKKIPQGDASEGAREKINSESTIHDGSKCAKVLDIKYHSLETTVEDMAKSLKSRFDI